MIKVFFFVCLLLVQSGWEIIRERERRKLFRVSVNLERVQL